MERCIGLVIVTVFLVSCKTTRGSYSQSNSVTGREMMSFLSLNDPVPTGQRDLTTIDGRARPRIYTTTYRASNKQQLPLTKMLRGMFDDPFVPVESKLFTAMRFTLSDKPIPFKISDETKRVVTSIAPEAGRFSGQPDEKLIAYLMHRSFDHIRNLDTATLRDRYVYYKSKTYEDFSDNLIYTTTLPYIASFYGPRLVEINEWDSPVNGGKPRSADMNYLNYKKYGRWLDDGLPANLSFYWEDSEQLITPILIDGSAVTGYQIRDRYAAVDRTVQNSWNFFEIINKKLLGEFRSVGQAYSPIDVAFYKIRYRDETLVGVFSGKKNDGKDSTCMVRSLAWGQGWEQSIAKQIPHHCTELKPWQDALMGDESAALIGVIRLCRSHCSIPEGLLDGLQTRIEALSEDLVQEINETRPLDEQLGDRGRLRYLPVAPTTL